MTRVLMVDASDRGGIARETGDLVRRLRRERVDVALVAPRGLALDAPELPALPWGDEVAGWSSWRLRRVSIAAWLRRLTVLGRAIARQRPDVVHLQTAVTGPFDRALLWWCRRRAVVVRTIHNAVRHEDTRAGRREHRLWAAADHLVVHGSDAASIAAKAAGRPVHVIPFDLPDEVPPSRDDARRALGLGSEPTALVLGLLRPYKGIGLVADAWPGVLERVPGARLAVAGSVIERFDDLDRLLALPNVEHRIGWLDDDDVLAWVAAADVALLPYAHGAISGVLLRAVLAGTPSLVSPALAEALDRYAAGRVVPLDVDAWADAIASALTTPLPPPVVTSPGAQAAATAALYASITASSGRRRGS
jgi:glycosyltransferase involved in cell wall biosynthesis